MSSRDRARTMALLLAGASLVVSLAVPADAAPKAVRALKVATAADAADPNGAIWAKAPSVTVPLQPAPLVHKAVSGIAATARVTVRAVRTRDALFIRLAWQDRTEDRRAGDPGSFADGAAVQFALDGQSTTTILMGNPGGRVNIWYWTAGGRVESLLAEGFGTATRAPVQDVSGKGVHAGGTWTVVLSRSLKTEAEDGIRLEGPRAIPMAVAVWDGANRERDGFKAVSMEWHTLEVR